jgi:hypothetical protein
VKWATRRKEAVAALGEHNSVGGVLVQLLLRRHADDGALTIALVFPARRDYPILTVRRQRSLHRLDRGRRQGGRLSPCIVVPQCCRLHLRRRLSKNVNRAKF